MTKKSRNSSAFDGSLHSTSLTRIVGLLAFVGGLFFWASPLSASPWLLDEDEVVLNGRFDYQWADEEYLNANDEFVDNPYQPRPFPLDGQYQSSTFTSQIRLGVVEDLELAVTIPVKSVSYQSDPVILFPGGQNDGLDYYQENVVNLSQQVSGVGDIRYGLAYQLFEGRMAGSLHFDLKTPTGYSPPAGTFGREPKSPTAFFNNATDLASPDNVEDDVTLGDGQTDITTSFEFGWSLPSRTFLRADAGYALRLGGAGDEIRAGLQVGQVLGQTVLLTAGADFIYAIQKGENVGLSVAARDPDLPAEDYDLSQPTDELNVALRPTPLERDRLSATAGLIVRITEAVEANIAYTRTLWGQNTIAAQTLSFGTAVKFDISDTSQKESQSAADGETTGDSDGG